MIELSHHNKSEEYFSHISEHMPAATLRVEAWTRIVDFRELKVIGAR